jgi:hypothetical protein
MRGDAKPKRGGDRWREPPACLRQPGLTGEVAKLSTTASKRLQLAVEGSGVTAFIFRRTSPADQPDPQAAWPIAV